jgi:hypothetical protein
VATSALDLRALASERFLPVVLGYTASAREASVVVDGRLDRYSPKEPFEEPPPAA